MPGGFLEPPGFDPDTTPRPPHSGSGVLPPGGDPGGGPGGGPGGLSGSGFLNPLGRFGAYGSNPLVGQLLRRRDNIPAMLQKDEFVVNSMSAQEPYMPEILAAANTGGLDGLLSAIQGLGLGGQPQGYAGGGMVPPMMGRMGGMQAPMPMQPQMGMAQRMPHASHYGMGAPHMRGLPGMAPMAPQSPPHALMGRGMAGRLPVQHFAAGGAVDDPAASGQWNMEMPKAQPILSYQDWLWQTYKAGKHNIGKKDFDAKYRPEYDQYVARLNANNAGADNPMMKMMYQLLGQYGGEGTFGPGGSQKMMNAVLGQANNQANALTNRAMNAANVYGMDPAQAGATRLQALMGTNKDVANIMGGAQYNQLANQQQFGQNMLGNALGFNQNLVSGANNFANQSNLMGEQYAYEKANQPNPWMQALGSLGGSVAGAWLSPGGFFSGNKGGGGGGGMSTNMNPFAYGGSDSPNWNLR